jgi:hypothetical protein
MPQGNVTDISVACAGCGDDWPGLKRVDGLCRTCRAQPDHRRIAACPLCGRMNVAPDLHHIAGRRQHPTFALDVCLTCHDILSARQRTRWDPSWKTEAHPVRCIVQGVFDLVMLWWQRSGRRLWRQQVAELLRVVALAALAIAECYRLRGWGEGQTA